LAKITELKENRVEKQNNRKICTRVSFKQTAKDREYKK